MGDRGSITGVYLQSSEKFPAAFVVDASGRRSQAPKWLQSQGFTSQLLIRYLVMQLAAIVC
ncbi:hypothetical protein [Gloeocapsa sp. PCC 7428]|uniref:hypothetical protein n=1 Tax=Gloeocapsa sp. PCC 7428 TaxID=1173026 RepID=UPI0002D7F28A